MRAGVVVAQSRIQDEAVVDFIALADVESQIPGFEVGKDESPASAPVVLVFAADACPQRVVSIGGVAQAQFCGGGAFAEFSFQRVAGRGHVAVRDGFGTLLAKVVLVGKMGLRRPPLAIPTAVAEYLQMVDPLVGQVDVAPGMVVVDVGETHLQPVGIGKESTA